MEMTRRQFGVSMLAGIAALIFAGLLGRIGLLRGRAQSPRRASFWRASGRLAG